MLKTASQRNYVFAVLVVALATLVCFGLFEFLSAANLVMVYLLATVGVATRGHRGASALSAVLSVLCFDFFFVAPRFSFNVTDMEYIWTFFVMFASAMIISHLTIRIREKAEALRQGDERTAWLLEKAKKAEVETESERLRSSLLSSVSHDFRTPLAAIVGSAEALLAREEIRQDPSKRELAQNIQTEGERLSRVVNNLLQATRLEAGELALQKENTPLEEIVGSALERLSSLLEQRRVNVRLPEDLPLIPMDGMLVEQVFINLLENAARHTPEGTPIEITARQAEKFVEVIVSDRGPGLSEEQQKNVFSKFYKSRESHGVGLGLAICRAVVVAHGGMIDARNQEGGGAAFRLMLPLR